MIARLSLPLGLVISKGINHKFVGYDLANNYNGCRIVLGITQFVRRGVERFPMGIGGKILASDVSPRPKKGVAFRR